MSTASMAVLRTGSGVKWRAAVIGCGWIGSEVADDPRADGVQAHAAAYAACPDTQLVAVCDPDPVRGQRAAKRWGLESSVPGVTELLAKWRPQIVSVCTPDATHAPILSEVLVSPDVRAVIAEKPLALDLDQARSVRDLAENRGIPVAVNYTRRFLASHIEARERLAAGEIGTPVAVQGLYTKGIIHNGSHWFDLARWFIGEVTAVRAWPGPGHGSDPTCHVRMTFEDGQTGFLLGLDQARFTAFEMDVIGTAGRLRITDSGRRFEWSTVADSPNYSGYRSLLPSDVAQRGFQDAAACLVDNVVAALESGAALKCSATDGLAALAVCDAARRSLLSGEECRVT